MKVVGLAMCAASVATLVSCARPEAPKRISTEDFTSYISVNKIGRISTGSDYWLEKKVGGTLDTWGKVVLVFGYVGNFEPCRELAAYFESSYPDNRYRCVPANYYPPKFQ